MDSLRTAIPTRRISTHTRRTVIHIMGGTIPGLGTATASMDIRTIGDQSIETRDKIEHQWCSSSLFSR
jgi:hypothetical protein